MVKSILRAYPRNQAHQGKYTHHITHLGAQQDGHDNGGMMGIVHHRVLDLKR
jgi:hypothetical protein